MMQRWARAWHALWREGHQGRAATLAELFLLGWAPAVLPRPGSPVRGAKSASEKPASPSSAT